MKRPKKVREHQVLLTRVQVKDMNQSEESSGESSSSEYSSSESNDGSDE